MGIKTPVSRQKKEAFCLMLAAFLVLFPALGFGATEAQIKIEQAKVKFSEQEYKESLKLLDSALSEEPENGEAYHYAGLCQMALDKPEAAVPLLEEGARLMPDNPGVREDLAGAALNSEQFEKALSAADSSLQLDPDRPRATLVKGQAMIGLNNYQDALAVFERVSRMQGYEQAGLYYMAICKAHLGLTQEAAEYFERAAAADPDTDMGRDAKKYADALRGEPVKAEKKKPWGARIRVLYQYDYNIVPVHSDDFLPEEISNKEDGRVVADLDLHYNFLDTGAYQAKVRYLGYGSWHASEHEYDLMYHMGQLGGYYNLNLGDYPTRVGANADYSTAALEGDHYSDYWKGTPYVSVTWNQMLKTRLVFDYKQEEFDDDFNLEDEMDKNNSQMHLALYQHFIFMEGNLNTWVGYEWGEVNAKGDNYDRRDNSGLGGAMLAVPGNGILSCSVRYQERDYPNNTFDRRERRTSVNASFQMPIYEMISLYTSVVYMASDGNVKTLDYERSIYSAGLLASF